MKKLKLGLPKGSLQESTIEIFRKAGIRVSSSDRSYFPSCDDEELEIMLRKKFPQPWVFRASVRSKAGLTGFPRGSL